MQRLTPLIATASLAVSLLTLLRFSHTPVEAASSSWEQERMYPPLVFTSRATLNCSISANANGRQILKTVSGSGFDFDATMLPIKGGLVQVKTPGMMYKFEAFPSTAVNAHFGGIGDGKITELKAEVEVDVKRFQQIGGPGTNITFNASDINSNGAYVELTGLFVRQTDHKRFPFRVIFGEVTEGGGNVLPATPEATAPLLTKAVVLGTTARPALVTTALYEAEDNVKKLE